MFPFILSILTRIQVGKLATCIPTNNLLIKNVVNSSMAYQTMSGRCGRLLAPVAFVRNMLTNSYGIMKLLASNAVNQNLEIAPARANVSKLYFSFNSLKKNKCGTVSRRMN